MTATPPRIVAETVLRQRPQVAWRVYDGEAYLVLGDRMHSLNGVGTEIWAGAESATSVAEIAQRVCAQFAVDEEEALRDVIEFADVLVARELLEVVIS